jgi:hypothetical protein
MKEKFNCRGGHEPAAMAAWSTAEADTNLRGRGFHGCRRHSSGRTGAVAALGARGCRICSQVLMPPGTGVDIADSAHAAPWRMRDSPPKLPPRERGPSPHGGGVIAAEGAESSRRAWSRHGGREGTGGGGSVGVTTGARASAAAGAEASWWARGYRRRMSHTRPRRPSSPAPAAPPLRDASRV